MDVIFAASALFWRWQYCECNPDVGMGPSLEMVLGYLEQEWGFTLDDKLRGEVLATVYLRLNHDDD